MELRFEIVIPVQVIYKAAFFSYIKLQLVLNKLGQCSGAACVHMSVHQFDILTFNDNLPQQKDTCETSIAPPVCLRLEAIKFTCPFFHSQDTGGFVGSF